MVFSRFSFLPENYIQRRQYPQGNASAHRKSIRHAKHLCIHLKGVSLDTVSVFYTAYHYHSHHTYGEYDSHSIEKRNLKNSF